MPPIVTANAKIMCSHGGQVVLLPKQPVVTIQGGAVLREPDLIGAEIVGCTQAGPQSKPCTTVVSTLPGATSLKVVVAQGAAYVAGLSGATDGVPPGTITVISPGQMTVQG